MTRTVFFRSLAWLCLAGCGYGCERDPDPRPEPARERRRRVIEPPVGIVRPLPPHLISEAGVGPYRLNDRLADLLMQLPSGPRIAVYEIPGLLHLSLIRAEEGDSVLIGGEPNTTAAFVTVVDGAVAKTDAGIHVGSTRKELDAAHGPFVVDVERALDPRVVIPRALQSSRIVIDKNARITAIVIRNTGANVRNLRADPITPGQERPADVACPRPAATATSFGACLTGVGELVEVEGNVIAVRAAESEKTLAVLRIPATVVFAAPLRFEGRDELVVITRDDEPALRTWSLVAYRFELGKVARSADPAPLYQLSAANARWIGADLRDIDLFLELTSGPESIEVGGLLTTRSETSTRPIRGDVVVISPVSVPRRHGKSAPNEESSRDAGPGSDAGATRAKP